MGQVPVGHSLLDTMPGALVTDQPGARPSPRHILLPLLLAGIALPSLLALTVAAQPGPDQTEAQYEARVRESKARAIELMSQGARRRMAAARRDLAAEHARRRRGLPPATPGTRQRPVPPSDDGTTPPLEMNATTPRHRAHGTATVPANVMVNNPAGDSPTTTQAEQMIASWGNYVLVAYNDGIASPHYQGYAYSTDGGQTFVDGGAPPALSNWVWASDPVVTVNQKTGVFYYLGLIDIGTSSNGIGVVRATFSGTTLTWSTPVQVRSVNTTSALLDKPWMVADSLNGNLYLTYTTFDASNRIDFQRSTNGGTSWSSASQISASADNGTVQGSRPAVGPAGEVYATWSAIGSVPEDFIRFRKSTNLGSSWSSAVTPATQYLNFGTGAPGFNRERGVDYPSIAVDRTTGPQRGRVYLAWTECINKYNDALNTLGNVVEAEENGFYSRANPFTVGQRLRGTLGSTSDRDYFSFTATQGVNYIFECDSVPLPLYTLRVLCGPDTTSRLAFSGDLTAPAGGRAYIVWTAPTSGTYYLRLAALSGGAAGGYRVSTGVAAVGPERGRDSRDVFAAYTDNGTSWSTPVRVNDTSALYNEFLPEIMVAADGMPYVTWFDWRDDVCGARSYQYLSRSGDGGVTWGANQRFSDVQNNWTAVSQSSNLAPDMGDYSHLYADPRYLRPAWADGRLGNPDVFTTRIDTWHDLTACQGALGADVGTSIHPSWTVTNRNPLLANTYGWTLTSQRNWPLTAVGSVAVAADASATIDPTITIPDTAAVGVNRMCLTATNAKGTRSQSCCFDLTVQPAATGVPPQVAAFDLRAGVPNPASHATRLDFSLPYGGPVQLRIYGLRGELVRTLVNGDRPAGPNAVTWDGRDDHGNPAPAGAYFCRLEGFGKVRVQRLVWLR